MDLGKIREAAADGMLVREMARMEEERVSWRQALVHTDSIAKQMKELSQWLRHGPVQHSVASM